MPSASCATSRVAGKSALSRAVLARGLASLASLASLAATLLTGVVAVADEFPARPIRMLIPQPPGGSMDANMRVLAEPIERDLGVRVVIDNRAGANGIIAGELLGRAPADGYTLLYTSNSFANNQVLLSRAPFDVLRDFTPLTLAATMPGYMVLVHPSVNANSLGDLVALSRRDGQAIHYGSGGIGNSQHLLGELINARTGARMVHVPYKGLAPMTTGLISNEIQVAFAAPTTVLPLLASNRLKALAYTGSRRWPGAPEVPTVAEAGVPGFSYEAAWHGVFAPASLPAPVAATLQRAFDRALRDDKVREFFQQGGYVPVGGSGAEFARYLGSYLRDMGELIRVAGVKPE
jgi:tripartite-type tricarboxylate transporter receptor subunit TctC